MYEDLIEVIGTGKRIGFFGDKNFPNGSHGKLLRDKTEAFRRLQRLLLALEPKKIYVCPELGLSNSLLAMFLMLRIPYCIVNPYRGYFDNIPKRDRLKLFFGLENSDSVVTMQEGKPETLFEQRILFRESQDFLVDNSEVIITAFGNNPDKDTVKTTDKLMSMDKPVIALSYAT